MAIVAIQLHRAIRPQKFCFQMYCVVQLNCARINRPWPQRGKFRMRRAETFDVVHELGGRPHRVQVRMALSAICVRRGCQEPVPSMLCVAGRTIGRENLIGMVHGAVVTGAAGLIVRFGVERASLLRVALAASCCEYRVPGGHFATAIDAIVVSNRRPCQPDDGQYRQQNRQPCAPAAKRVGALEVVHIDSLRQLFCRQL